MWPILIRIGDYEIGTFGVLLGLAVLTGLWVARRLGVRDGLAPQAVNDVGLATLLAALLFSKLLGLSVDWLSGIPITWGELRNAGAVHGGVFGGLITAALLARRFGLPLDKLLDAYLPAGALGQAIGRLGCLAAGCCFGTHSKEAWAVTFSHPQALVLGGVPLHVAVHPVQLYDALAHLLIFGALVALHKKNILVGRLFGLWCILEGVTRFSIETFRGDLGRGVWFDISWLSTGRITALTLIAVGILFVLIQQRRRLTDSLSTSPKPKQDDTN